MNSFNVSIFLIVLITFIAVMYMWHSRGQAFPLELNQPAPLAVGPLKQPGEYGFFKFLSDKDIQYIIIAKSTVNPTYLKIFSPFEAWYLDDAKIVAQIIADKAISERQWRAGKRVAKGSYQVQFSFPGHNFDGFQFSGKYE